MAREGVGLLAAVMSGHNVLVNEVRACVRGVAWGLAGQPGQPGSSRALPCLSSAVHTHARTRPHPQVLRQAGAPALAAAQSAWSKDEHLDEGTAAVAGLEWAAQLVGLARDAAPPTTPATAVPRWVVSAPGGDA